MPKVRISERIFVSIADDRCLSYGPYARITAPGVYDVTDAELEEIADDAGFQGWFLDYAQPGETRAYRALYRKLTGRQKPADAP